MNLTVVLASANPISHVADHPHVQAGGLTILSNHILMQLAAALLLVLIIPAAVRMRKTGDEVSDLSPRGLGNFFETICNYLREEVARPALGEHTDRFIGYLWTAFFFILFCNLLGLLPLPAVTKH